jgi:hypothetical protein
MDTSKLLAKGDIIELKEGHCIYAVVQNRFIYSNARKDKRLSRTDITIDNKRWNKFKGRYVVLETTFDGGGTGHGPGDIFPDGHHVHCQRLTGYNTKVDFYQTGCFTAMITNITPIGKAKVATRVSKIKIKRR